MNLEAWPSALNLLLTACVTLGQLINHSASQSPYLQYGLQDAICTHRLLWGQMRSLDAYTLRSLKLYTNVKEYNTLLIPGALQRTSLGPLKYSITVSKWQWGHECHWGKNRQPSYLFSPPFQKPLETRLTLLWKPQTKVWQGTRARTGL